MKTLLTIDHNIYLLPGRANIAALMKSLGSSRRVTWRPSNTTDHYIVHDHVRIKIETVDDNQVIEEKPSVKVRAHP